MALFNLDSDIVLITGGAGFIGSHLARSLVQKGVQSRVLDLVKPQVPIPGVEYIQGDVCDSSTVDLALEGVHTVFHFAAKVSVPLCQKRPFESYQTNVLSTALLLEKISNKNQNSSNPMRLVFSSSASVYGALGKNTVSLSETETITQPLSIYSAQKQACEHAIRLFHQTHPVPAVVFRFFNVYGPGQDPHSPYSGVISIFTEAANHSKPVCLFGSGLQTRDFISVHDIAKACELALSLSDAKCDGTPINLGSGRSITVKDLLEEIMQITAKKIEIEKLPSRPGDVMHSRAAIEKAKTLLKWVPERSLADGLKELLRSPS